MQEQGQPGGGAGHPPEHERPLGWDRTSVSALLIRGPVLFWGCVLVSNTVGAADAAIIDGRDSSGRRFLPIYAGTTLPSAVILPRPVRFEVGIFAYVGANVQDILVLYDPLEG